MGRFSRAVFEGRVLEHAPPLTEVASLIMASPLTEGESPSALTTPLPNEGLSLREHLAYRVLGDAHREMFGVNEHGEGTITDE